MKTAQPQFRSQRDKLSSLWHFLVTEFSTAHPRKPLILALSLCVAVTFSFANNRVLAAEEGAKPQQQTSSSETSDSVADDSSKQAQTDQKKQPKRKTDSEKNKEIFRPSEEISEDFAVSFPVDI